MEVRNKTVEMKYSSVRIRERQSDSLHPKFEWTEIKKTTRKILVKTAGNQTYFRTDCFLNSSIQPYR